jgi:hypothetical protein
MMRSFALGTLVLCALATAGCNAPSCGPGTKEVQGADGDVQCVPAEQQAAATPCDVDGGTVEIAGGLCESHIKCDPGTTMYDPATGVCVGTASGGGNGCAPCPSPIPAGKVCLTGGVVDFGSGMHVMGGASSRPLRIAAYEPLSFLGDPTSAPLAEEPSTTKGCFTLVVQTPATGLVVLAVSDPVGSAPAMPLTIGGAGAQVVAGGKYNVDGYLVPKSFVDGYAAVNPAFASAGTYVACFYGDAPPSPTNLVFTETMPTAGVSLLGNAAPLSAARYLKSDRTIDTTLTATGALGCAVTVGTGALGQFSGMGGGVAKWETQPGGTAPGVVVVARLHSCANAPAGTATCQ